MDFQSLSRAGPNPRSSSPPALMRNVGESLAGRMAVLELSPFTLGEVDDLDRLWRCGGFPDGGILDDDDAYPGWQENYVRSMTERDLPAWGLPAKPRATQRLLRMAAAEQGAILNLSKLGQSLGLSHHTVDKTCTAYPPNGGGSGD